MPKSLNKRQKSMAEFAIRAVPGQTPRREQNGSEAGSEVADTEGAAEEEMTVKQLLLAMKESMAAVASAVERLTARFDSEQTRVAALEVQLREAETRVGALEDEMVPLKKKVEEADKKIREALRQVHDQEARGRRNNVRVVGLPEFAPNGSMEEYMEKVLRAALPEAVLSPLFTVERAHRALMVRPPPGAPPRAVIVRLMNYRDRDAVLRAARVAGEVRFEGSRLSLFPDFTLEVQKQRKTFWDIKQLLRNKNVNYAMLYPAKLRILHAGRAHFFTEPAAARDYIERHLATPRRGTPTRNPRQNGDNNNNTDVAPLDRNGNAGAQLASQIDMEHITDSQLIEGGHLLDDND